MNVTIQQKMQIEAIRIGLADAEAGRVVDHEIVTAWLESWGTDKELPAPKLVTYDVERPTDLGT